MSQLVKERIPVPWENDFKCEVVSYLEHPNCSFLLKNYSDIE